jgi:hypothetical protein
MELLPASGGRAERLSVLSLFPLSVGVCLHSRIRPSHVIAERACGTGPDAAGRRLTRMTGGRRRRSGGCGSCCWRRRRRRWRRGRRGGRNRRRRRRGGWRRACDYVCCSRPDEGRERRIQVEHHVARGALALCPGRCQRGYGGCLHANERAERIFTKVDTPFFCL